MKITLHTSLALCLVLLAGSLFGLRSAEATRLQTRGGKQPAPVFKPTKFEPTCTNPSYPSPAPTASLEIDAQCGLAGSGSGPEGQQDMTKNNFCAEGTPEPITIADLKALQTKVVSNKAINFGSANRGTRKKGPTTNRGLLKTLGEGKLVTLKAFVLIARQEGGESVNCGKNLPAGALLHDIHISLVGSPRVTSECSSVVAEMSPHHRPDAWTHGNVAKVAKAKLPVRVTGQLYFDSSHFPCAGSKSAGQGNPSRTSLWEIHPIYKFEVCTADCDAAGTWLALDEWAAQK